MHRLMQDGSEDFELFDGEKVELVIRRHWAMDLLIFLRFAFLGLGVSGFVCTLFFVLGGEFLTPSFWVLSFSLSAYLILVTIGVFVQWLNATFDIIFVTSDRVIDISQIDFFHRNVIETRLENIQDATGEVKGFLNTIFDWGKIQIRTANDIADFSIDAVQSPQLRSREIFQFANKARETEKKRNYEMQRDIRNKDKEYQISRTLKKEGEKNASKTQSIQESIHNKIQPITSLSS